MGREEPGSEGDNAILKIECFAEESSNKSWGITARYKFKYSNGANGTWYDDGVANYLLVPK
jgi:hypothetical protein